MENMKAVALASLISALFVANLANAQDRSCTDGAGSDLQLVSNPDKTSQSDTLIMIKGPVVSYLFPANIQASIATRYGRNAQDYRFNQNGEFVMYASTMNDPQFPLVLVAKGGENEIQVSVRTDSTGVALFVDSESWYFGTCN